MFINLQDSKFGKLMNEGEIFQLHSTQYYASHETKWPNLTTSSNNRVRYNIQILISSHMITATVVPQWQSLWIY